MTNLPVSTRFRLPASCYSPDRYRKDLIVLHFTAGTTAEGAFASFLARNDLVSTAYIVDRDGAIYELFDPRFWAFHLGIKQSVQDKRSIAIEIVNVGPLRRDRRDPTQWNWWAPASRFTAPYCKDTEKELYLERRYRGFDAWAVYPDQQIDSVVKLVSHLADRFDIPHQTAPARLRPECNQRFYANYQGIAAHQNFRQDKSDVGPAFPWDRLKADELDYSLAA